MYNNTIIQTSYKPYVPLPKKKVAKDDDNSKSANKQQIVQPNNYSGENSKNKSSSDTFSKTPVGSTKININQLLIDFTATLNAIGASEDVENEVKTYLNLVKNQSQKDKPNKKMIVSNLKIAADVLDNYITETLNKPSKVVKDWVDALLIQNIDYKADNSITKGAFESITGEKPQTAKLAEKKLAEKAQVENNNLQVQPPANTQTLETQIIEQTDNTQEQQEISDTYVSTTQNSQQDEIDKLLDEADDLTNTQPKQALATLSEAFKIAQAVSDNSSMAKIYSKIANVQNNMNNLPQALDCYNASTKLAYKIGNDELKTQNHKQMAKIYDDAGYMDTALGHYYQSLSIDGKLDDTENQSDTLTDIGNMYSQRYQQDEAVDYYKDALALAKVTKNIDIMSNIFYNTGLTFERTGSDKKALDNYKNAAILSEKSGNKEALYNVYEKAGDLMQKMNYSKRAADLYTKSYRLAEKLDNTESLNRLKTKILATK